jgi:DAACS family dicarboxylate/amino acid:cation (Na+ or H+) symporter
MVIIGFAMAIAPLGVAGLIFGVTARFGLDVLQSLGMYVIVVLAGLSIHLFGVIPLRAKTLAGIDPATFFRRSRALMVTASPHPAPMPPFQPPSVPPRKALVSPRR